ncbi:MAG: ribosome assembly RNA-binding protein YhbY [Clostridiales bacterium]|nr:ribosome assembly RNA-binding protein YhbY [Clostridiales bacterium]
MLTSKQRAYLRGMAAMYDTIFQVGKGGISDNMCEQISNALEARELIKLRVLENCDYNAKEAAPIIAEKVNADVVQVIGTRFVLYRESQDHKKIDLKALK